MGDNRQLKVLSALAQGAEMSGHNPKSKIQNPK
jgi:hypothetical protein